MRPFYLLNLALVSLLAMAVAVGAAEPSLQTEFVVLQNGEVLAGTVEPEGDRLVVRTGRVDVQVPRREVLYRGPSLADCYQQRRQGLHRDDVEGWISLTDWALDQRLLAQAESTLAELRRIAPRDQRVDLLAQRLAGEFLRRRREQAAAAPAATQTSDPPLPVAKGAPAVMPVSAIAVAEFAETIQPLLLNRCALGGCHGPRATNRFSLERTGSPKNVRQSLTYRNLDAAQRWIAREDALASPLLTKPLAAGHGGRSRPVFAGTRDRQYQQLLLWVARVASQPATPQVGQLSAAAPDQHPTAVAHVAATVASDPFDPEVFNRRYHPVESTGADAEDDPLAVFDEPPPTRPAEAAAGGQPPPQ
ncbi:MAG: hypothetical protein K1X74_21005 [Pirellulales bacterium]|nr:hypothetical protein [Pirellulales bacterium]